MAQYTDTSESRELVERALQEVDITVSFLKQDGTKRDMRCTLRKEILPVQKVSDKAQRAPNPDVQIVWDLEAEGWRSFRWDSITDFIE